MKGHYPLRPPARVRWQFSKIAVYQDEERLSNLMNSRPKKVPRVYSLMSLTAHIVGQRTTADVLRRAPAEVQTFLQRYVSWWNQIGVFDTVREWHANGQLRREVHVQLIKTHTGSKWMRHGEYKRWRKNGLLRTHATYAHGEAHGLKTKWDKYGYMSDQVNFMHGRKHDWCTFWYYAAGVVVTAMYCNGLKNGSEDKYCLSTGMILSSTKYNNDKRHKVERAWDQNGILTLWAKYENDNRRGLHVRMSPDGRNPMHVKFYRSGKALPCVYSQITPIRSGSRCIEYISDHPLVSPAQAEPLPTKYVTTEAALKHATWNMERCGAGGDGRRARIKWGHVA